jgi:hypothetical protein
MSNGLSWYTRLPRRSIRSYPQRPSSVHLLPRDKASWVEPQIGPNDDCFDGYPESLGPPEAAPSVLARSRFNVRADYSGTGKPPGAGLADFFFD